MKVRPVAPEDLQAAHEVTTEGLETYRTFAPPGWAPPTDLGAEGVAVRLAREGAYGVVAVDEDAVVGFAAYEPAREAGDDGFTGPLIAGLAHVWAVFVAESHWGRGVATRLLGALIDDMRQARFPEARLYVAAGQARARRFYAREGWREVTAPFFVGQLGLDLVEMRRSL